MIYTIKALIKSCICTALVLFTVDVSAQVSLVQNAINKLEGSKSFSYHSVNKQKEIFIIDTVTEQHNAVFVKEPGDKNFGYLFNIKTLNEDNKLTYTDLYNGKNLIHMVPRESTYSMWEIRAFNIQGTLPGCLKWVQSRLKKKSSQIIKTNDTTINGVDSHHLIANVYDTIINKERNYTYVHLYFDKLSGMPDYIIIKSRNTTFGNGVSTYYSESHYSDYKFNQDNVDIASITVPKGFHLPKEQPTLPLLTAGTVAPDWTLYATDGKRISLTQMKGKVVLLDFYFIGCSYCMLSLEPLNKLYEKYKNKNVVIASITERDSKRSVLAFDKNYHIKYPGYIDAADVVKSYHVAGFPTFYFIDKAGKIANVQEYSDGFEGKAISIIDDLLKK